MTKKQRRRSWGSVTEVKRGKQYTLRWMQNTPEGRKRKTKTVYCTYREACTELDRLHTEHANDLPVPTVRRAYEMWVLPLLDRRLETGTLALSTYTGITSAWRNHVCPRWGDVPITELRAIDLQEWLLTLSLGAATSSLSTLSRVFERAATYMPLPLNPFAANVKYELPRANTKKRSKKVYNLAQALEVLDRLHGTTLEAPFILACFAGCRSGESLAVKTSDVHAIACGQSLVIAAPVFRQMPQGGRTPVDSVKTERSNRTTFVLPHAAHRLMRIRDAYASEGREWLGDRGDGTPMNRSIVSGRWKAFCKSTGTEYIPWSNLRNSWRTICEIELRLPWDLCELLMGHTLPGMSGTHYIRPSVEQLACAFSKALGINKDI
jgi:integrase